MAPYQSWKDPCSLDLSELLDLIYFFRICLIGLKFIQEGGLRYMGGHMIDTHDTDKLQVVIILFFLLSIPQQNILTKNVHLTKPSMCFIFKLVF